MNASRRNQIKKIASSLKNIKNQLQDLLDEEQDAFDNMPENLQGSIRGSDSENAIDLMNETIEFCENAIDLLEEI